MVQENIFLSSDGGAIVTFPEVLKKLRTQRGLTQLELAKIFGVTDRAIRMYEAGSSMPSLSFAIALADYFGVSLDYLVGRSDDPRR
jgi:transcriptional regulator with XRE-family HTH domain